MRKYFNYRIIKFLLFDKCHKIDTDFKYKNYDEFF